MVIFEASHRLTSRRRPSARSRGASLRGLARLRAAWFFALPLALLFISIVSACRRDPDPGVDMEARLTESRLAPTSVSPHPIARPADGFALEGRVVDSKRRPVPEAIVHALLAPTGKPKGSGGELGVVAGPVPPIPAAGARVPVEAPAKRGAPLSFKAVTDEHGRFRFDRLPAPRVSLIAEHPRYLSSPLVRASSAKGESASVPLVRLADLVLGAARRGRVLERRGLSLAGVTLDSSGSPLSGVRLRVSAPAGVTRKARSGRDGAFVLRGLREGRWSLHAARDGYETVELSVQAGDELALTLRRLGVVRGRVLDWRTGAALSRFTVASAAGLRHFRRAAGDFLLELPPGRQRLTVRAPGYAAADATADIQDPDGRAQDDPISIELRRAGSIFGVVEATDGQRLGDATISWSGGSASAKSDGSFRLDGVPEGRITLRARAAGETELEGVVELDVRADHSEGPVVIQVPASAGRS